MSDGLDKIRVIDRAVLSTELYFQSLLEQAHGKGLLGDNDMERLQYECLDLLADKVKRYNAGDSNSIRMEKAQSIMVSNLFTIGLWLKTYLNPDDAVIALKNEPINELYQKGRKRIDTMIMAAKAVQKKMLEQLVETKNVFYRSTIKDGINGFFKLYYADFTAQEIHITADYPIYNPVPKLAGIEFIQTYVNALYYENQFCGYFSADNIHHLLCGYAKDYQELVINIYELILTAAIGCIIAGTDARHLDITDSGAEYLCQFFSGMSEDEIDNTVRQSVTELIRCFKCSDELVKYIKNSLPLIAGKIKIAARENMLDRVFFLPEFPENKPKIFFSSGNKMADDQYRKVMEEIRQCRFLQDKITIIKEYIRSFADLEDVLLEDDWEQEETKAVLYELDVPEIAALLKKYPLLSKIDMIDFREQERLLRITLDNFISQLPPKKQEQIKMMSEIITEEEEKQ